MNVDPVLFLAQLFNFLILVGLLGRVLYGPVLKVVSLREEGLRKREAEALQAREAAEVRLQECSKTAGELARKRSEMLVQLEAEASVLRCQLEARLRTELEEERGKRMSLLKRELEGLGRSLQHRLGASLLQACRRCLSDLADRSLEEQVARHLLERWHQLDVPTNGQVVVRSTFPLSLELQERFRREVRATDFVTDPDLGFGIEVESGGRLAGWALSGYLESLERELPGALREGTNGPA